MESRFPICLYSNRLEIHYDYLKKALFHSEAGAFAKRWVIVPHLGIRRWLSLRLMEDVEIGAMLGVEFMLLPEAMRAIGTTFFQKSFKYWPRPMEIAFALEWEIRERLRQFEELSFVEQERWGPIVSYIGPDSFSRRACSRIHHLSSHLSRLFHKYGVYGAPFQESEGLDWQGELWHALFHKEQAWSYPLREIEHCLSTPLGQLEQDALQNAPQIHVFGLSYLAPLYLNLLFHTANFTPLTLYLPSPTRAFWEDLRSDKENRRLQAYWKGKGAPLQERENLEDYLRDTNPLLANWGRAGREFLLKLGEREFLSHEHYEMPAALADSIHYQELIDNELDLKEETVATLLQKVQTDLLLLRNPTELPPQSIEEEWLSIQIHNAPSPWREVEVLYNLLLETLLKHSEEAIQPQDILVLAPNMEEYAPYIKAVFERKESSLPIQFSEQPLIGQSDEAKGLYLLLQLPDSRWHTEDLLELFENSAFCRKHGLSQDEMAQLRLWVKDTKIRWGADEAHCQEILSRDYRMESLLDTRHAATWEEGVKRLLWGLAMAMGSPANTGIDLTQTELLGKWIEWLHSLREDLSLLTQETALTLPEWAEYLNCLTQSYFAFDPQQTSSVTAHQRLNRVLQAFQIELPGGEKRLPFSAIKPHLLAQLRKESAPYEERTINAVQFASLVPMRVVPAKIICLLGMQEGAFPSRSSLSPFDKLRLDSLYCPDRADEERYLFLDCLLAARRYLFLLYQGQTSSDHKEQSPCIPLLELMHYLKQYYPLSQGNYDDQARYCHSAYPFHQSYFNGGDKKSFSSSHFAQSMAFYRPDKRSLPSFIPEFCEESPVLNPAAEVQEWSLDLALLSESAKNPLKLYFRKALGFLLNTDSRLRGDAEEAWVLHPLEKHQLRREALLSSPAQALERAENEGRLPLGGFKQAVCANFTDEVEELKASLDTLGIDPHHTFSLTFCPDSKVSIQDEEGNWRVPSLKVPYQGKEMAICGRIEGLTSQGLLVMAKVSKQEWFKLWPLYLILQTFVSQNPFPAPCEAAVIFALSGEKRSLALQRPESDLEEYLHYYFLCLQNPSPLFPEWIPLFLQGDRVKFDEKIQSDLRSPWSHFYHDYAKWAFQLALPKAASLLTLWQETAKTLFASLDDEREESHGSV